MKAPIRRRNHISDNPRSMDLYNIMEARTEYERVHVPF